MCSSVRAAKQTLQSQLEQLSGSLWGRCRRCQLIGRPVHVVQKQTNRKTEMFLKMVFVCLFVLNFM